MGQRYGGASELMNGSLQPPHALRVPAGAGFG
jgi:hypothetical protein